MSARFRFTKSAATDLVEIADYISDEDPPAAERVVGDIVSAIEMLTKFPEMGRIREDLADRRHRVWPVRSQGRSPRQYSLWSPPAIAC